MRVLLVEDEFLIALDAEMALEAAGHEVIGPFASHSDAMNAARQERPDVAMVDINLAGCNEGLEIVRDLYDELGIRSFFATGQANLAREHRGAAFGVLQKPYSADDLINTLPVLIRIAEGGAPPPPAVPAGFELFRD